MNPKIEEAVYGWVKLNCKNFQILVEPDTSDAKLLKVSLFNNIDTYVDEAGDEHNIEIRGSFIIDTAPLERVYRTVDRKQYALRSRRVNAVMLERLKRTKTEMRETHEGYSAFLYFCSLLNPIP